MVTFRNVGHFRQNKRRDLEEPLLEARLPTFIGGNYKYISFNMYHQIYCIRQFHGVRLFYCVTVFFRKGDILNIYNIYIKIRRNDSIGCD